jgi:hypothetical protein
VTWVSADMAPGVTDGAGTRYRVIGMRSMFTLQSEETGRYVLCDEETLRSLDMDLDPAIAAITSATKQKQGGA